MRHRGRGVRNRQYHVQIFLLLPPLVPLRFIRFPLRYQFPLLHRTVLSGPIEQVRPQGISFNVFGPEVVHVADRSGEGGPEG